MKRFITAIAIVLLLASCAHVVTPDATAPERSVTLLPVGGDLLQRNAEISGMSWCGDWLVFLPQYPDFSGAGSYLYALHRDSLQVAVYGGRMPDLTPITIPFSYQDAVAPVAQFEGFEAIVFDGTTMYLTIEADAKTGVGYVVRGTMAQDMSAAQLDASSLTQIALPGQVSNAGFESMMLYENTLYLWYEANGANNNPQPHILLYSTDLKPIGLQPQMPVVEYRITDASQPMNADHQRIWLINYFWPGDAASYNPAEDGIAAAWGLPGTHASSTAVERLLPLTMQKYGSVVKLGEPVYLQLQDDGESRNWEAIALLNDDYAILATDKFPATLIGFVRIAPAD